LEIQPFDELSACTMQAASVRYSVRRRCRQLVHGIMLKFVAEQSNYSDELTGSLQSPLPGGLQVGHDMMESLVAWRLVPCAEPLVIDRDDI
jgi:hypothetical protein